MKQGDQLLFEPGEEIRDDGNSQIVRYSASRVRQGDHVFYTLTMHISVLAATCYVSPRFEDPKLGFQRRLDKIRAKQIADYIDVEHGVIPNSIILSAQPDADFKVIGRGKTIEFRETERAFLVLDGQHRVYGFTQAETYLRVPVVIFNNLSPSDEVRLFMDINTKQRPVPNELLLDIKKLAGYETETEQLLGEIYDLFNSESDSPLLGMLSPFEKATGKLSRVTFNAAVKPVLPTFRKVSAHRVYRILAAYIGALNSGASGIGASGSLTHPQMFRALMRLFPDVVQMIPDRDYTADSFAEVISPLFKKKALFRNPGTNAGSLYEDLSRALKASFTI